MDEDLAFELLEPSGKYVLLELQRMCEVYLSESLSLENFIKVAQRAEVLNVGYLREAIAKFIVNNFEGIKREKDLNEIPKEILAEALSKQKS